MDIEGGEMASVWGRVNNSIYWRQGRYLVSDAPPTSMGRFSLKACTQVSLVSSNFWARFACFHRFPGFAPLHRLDFSSIKTTKPSFFMKFSSFSSFYGLYVLLVICTTRLANFYHSASIYSGKLCTNINVARWCQNSKSILFAYFPIFNFWHFFHTKKA